MAKLKDIKGIDEAMLAKLEEANVKEIADLQTLVGNDDFRKNLAEKVGATEEQLQEWASAGQKLEKKEKQEQKQQKESENFKTMILGGILKFVFPKLKVKPKDLVTTKEFFQLIMVVLIAMAATLGTQITGTAKKVDAQAEKFDLAGIKANINSVAVYTLSYFKTYQHYDSFTDYTINQSLADLYLWELEQYDGDDPEEEQWLTQQWLDTQAIAKSGQAFFPNRYIQPDGNYDVDRELGVLFAEASRKRDIDPAPHFEKADAQRDLANNITLLPVFVSVALFFFSFAQALHEDRRMARYICAGLGTIVLVGVFIATQTFN